MLLPATVEPINIEVSAGDGGVALREKCRVWGKDTGRTAPVPSPDLPCRKLSQRAPPPFTGPARGAVHWSRDEEMPLDGTFQVAQIGHSPAITQTAVLL